MEAPAVRRSARVRHGAEQEDAKRPRRKMVALEADATGKPAAESASSGKAVPHATLQPRTEVRPLEPEWSQIDWSQIVRRCMDGDSGAWAEMVRAHHRRVYGLCYRFTGNPADAEDLTQDVFLKIYSNLASFDAGAGQPAGLDHHHDPQPAGGQLPPHPEPAGDGVVGRGLGIAPTS